VVAGPPVRHAVLESGLTRLGSWAARGDGEIPNGVTSWWRDRRFVTRFVVGRCLDADRRAAEVLDLVPNRVTLWWVSGRFVTRFRESGGAVGADV
jgi:hypothetical protein